MHYMVIMNAAHAPTLSAVDLNLLPALDALLEEQHVTRAAQRVGLTQSAMSHALARLRVQTGDPLLVRTKAGLVLTKRAESMRLPLARVLGDATLLFLRPSFDPTTDTRTFRVGTSDYAELLLLPRIVERLSKEAPGVAIHSAATAGDATPALVDGRVDLSIAPIQPADDQAGVMSSRLWTDKFVCVVRRGHPLAAPKTKLTLARYVAASHALIAPRGQRGSYVDDTLEKLGMRRHVALLIPHFLTAAYVIARSDLVLTLAARVADAMAPELDLVPLTMPPELRIPPFTISSMWHARTNEDPAHRWFRGVVSDAARTV